MEHQAVTTDKDSGIVNDANLWATETMGNPKYPLDLFLRVIRVSLEINRMVAALPALELGDAWWLAPMNARAAGERQTSSPTVWIVLRGGEGLIAGSG